MIIYKSDKLFERKLHELAVTSGWHAPFYTKSSLRYYQQRPLDEEKKLKEKSFILEWEREPVAGFIGVIVESKGVSDLLTYEVPCFTVENKKKLTAKAIKVFLGEIDNILSQINGTVWYRDFLLDGNTSFLTTHLLKKGAIVAPVFSKVIDLFEDKSIFRSSLRRSSQPLVNWGLSKLNPEILTSKTISWDLMQEFRSLHIQESGRETRSEESWRRQYEMVKANEAFVIFGRIDQTLVAAGLFMYSTVNCYYGVSVSRRDLFDKPIFHAIMWTAILYAKEIGCRWFEAGEQHFPNHPIEKPPTKKELGISDFKAGFGGDTKLFLDLKL
jgi:hypothetical protein